MGAVEVAGDGEEADAVDGAGASSRPSSHQVPPAPRTAAAATAAMTRGPRDELPCGGISW